MALGTKWIQVRVHIRATETGWESGFEVLSKVLWCDYREWSRNTNGRDWL